MGTLKLYTFYLDVFIHISKNNQNNCKIIGDVFILRYSLNNFIMKFSFNRSNDYMVLITFKGRTLNFK